ncbi:MAG: tRNA lysidine(34) synthetase TilS [Kiritimatiellales bacterium]|nr:tRNA lysidine(34) synthetase TilS [Kiritimatiellales bacterium]
MSNTFLETIRAAIDRHGLIPAGTPVVAGVSGGADSVALLHAFQMLEIPVTVAHLNHQLRGAESDADERFVRELGFPVVVKSVDVRKLAEENNLSIEMAARKARHDFFAEFGDAVIALAHHADDQAETFILKLARGAGTEGLGGMPFFQTLGNLRLIRPMLGISRAEILQWLAENGFGWREDASNRDEAFLRNRVRHSILPLLEKELNPNIRETILRTMDILREENAWMDSLANATRLEAASTLKQPLALRRRVVRNWLFENGAEGVDFDAVESILALMGKGEGSAVFELNNRQRVVVEYGQPRFEEGVSQPLDPAWDLSMERGMGWKKDHGRGVGILPAEASFDAEKVGDAPIKVRGFEPGDRIQPLGMEGSCKLQDIFTDQKVPRAQRRSVPVVVCRGEIIWIPGYRTARGWEVCGMDGKSVHVRIEQSRTR